VRGGRELARRAGVWTAGGIAVLHASATPAVAMASGREGVDPFSYILLELAVIILVAAAGRLVAERLGQSPVLGELAGGVVLGNVGYWLGSPFYVIMMLGNTGPLFSNVWSSGLSLAETARQVYPAADMLPGGSGHRVLDILSGPHGHELVVLGLGVWMFSNLGVILLLMMAGLESSVEQMLQVGPAATLVAVVGVAVPFGLGVATSWWLVPAASVTTHVFLAATLCATSVGITARVFKDMGKLQIPEARIILGAAVIDDVLGLVILAVCSGMAASGSVEVGDVLQVSLASIVFLGAVLLFGEWVVRALAQVAMRVTPEHVKLFFPLVVTFVMAWLANRIGLATVVGAFAAGLILSEQHFENERGHGTATMQEVIGPLEALFAPVFFVLMGMQVNLQAFTQSGPLLIATLLTVSAVLGKLATGLAVSKSLDRLSVGIGMVPRGEVGLIFAGVGKTLGVLNDALFSAVVVMVIATTLLTPVALKWSLARGGAKARVER